MTSPRQSFSPASSFCRSPPTARATNAGPPGDRSNTILVRTERARKVEIDPERQGDEPDLFWALLGGGGSLGVVTALELQLLPVQTGYTGDPRTRSCGSAVLHAWRKLTDDARLRRTNCSHRSARSGA